MTQAEQKAKELVDRYWFLIDNFEKKQCALICVDEKDELIQLIREDLDHLPVTEQEIEQIDFWLKGWQDKLTELKTAIQKI